MEIKTVAIRDINVITAEIHNIQTDVQEYASRAALKIGEKLCEAKDLLAHGEFLGWVKEEFGWSERRAQQLMQVYKEFGGTQKNLFGPELNTNTFADLSFSKLLLLVSVPESEREEFVEENKVSEISVREMEKLVKQKQRTEEENARLDREVKELNEALDKLSADKDKLDDEWEEQIGRAVKGAEANAEKKWAEEVNTAKLDLKNKEAELKAAREETAKLKQDMAELRANPEVPEEILDKIRGQYASQLKEAEERERKAREELQEAEKRAKQSEPTVAVFKVHFESAQKELSAMKVIIAEAGDETAEKLRAAARAVMKTYTF